MRATKALKLTVEQRLGFEITLARSLIEESYLQMQTDLHNVGKYNPAAMIQLHEAERILAALERVNGDFYRRSIENEKMYREEKKRMAKECADEAINGITKLASEPPREG